MSMQMRGVKSTPKTQLIRIAGVVIIAPTMVYGGWLLRGRSPLVGYALIVFGAATAIYNAKNYHDVDVIRLADSAAEAREQQTDTEPPKRPDVSSRAQIRPNRPELRDFGVIGIGTRADYRPKQPSIDAIRGVS